LIEIMILLEPPELVRVAANAYHTGTIKGSQRNHTKAPRRLSMDTRSKEDKGHKGPVELHCDSRRCFKCYVDGYCEERFEDAVFGVGP
jgi:hypothetical protein